jgi:hypothetical protein
MLEPSGAIVVSIDGPRIAALAQFLLQLFHLPFQAFDAIESVVKAGVFHRLQPAEDGRERARSFHCSGTRWFAVSVIGSSD